jgi:preprotein translocase subunit SecA
MSEGIDPNSASGQQKIEKLAKTFETECVTEGEKVRQAGGLYVLGTERHESRRIDNQLRGRSGRQGDPGASRFYLSLDDDLMRLFAGGGMRGVMDRALPEDVPIESNMVSKAIERAQTTVEQKNAEARKNILKYDEVMNEQRKVIYYKRDQILNGSNLREEVCEQIEQVSSREVLKHCASEHPEEWEVDSLITSIESFWPLTLGKEEISKAETTLELTDLLIDDASNWLGERESELGLETFREVERQVMLRIIDQRWREHLYEMDHLREGIHLRAMGQRDPATEWQREGFELFGHLTELIGEDFLRYVMRIQVSVTGDSPTPSDVVASGPEGPVVGAAAVAAAAGAPTQVKESAPTPKVQKINDEWESTPRNAPCPCDSGRKFKHCHGR